MVIGMAEVPALVLLCKRPSLGHGKQRLARHLGVETAQRVAEALLVCAVEDAGSWPGPVIIAPASRNDYDWAITLLPPFQPQTLVIPQVSGNLGQRLNALDLALRRQGINQLVYIGSDAPNLGLTDYSIARERLQQYDTVLKPAIDGGVVLMSSCCEWPELSDLPWSTDKLAMALADACQAAGHSVCILEEDSDVDELDDFMRLTTQLARDHRPARRALHQLVCDIAAAKKIANAQL
ncbi:MAG: hypothetical protein NMNS01_08440 [Nitrosomonas sp.]|nr:MAG: hypothetical protein NMNS01_08440 [Nitrosomonas sp.]